MGIVREGVVSPMQQPSSRVLPSNDGNALFSTTQFQAHRPPDKPERAVCWKRN